MESEGETKSLSSMYSLSPCKAFTGPFLFPIKTTTEPIKVTF